MWDAWGRYAATQRSLMRAITLEFESKGQSTMLLGESELVKEMFYHILHNAMQFAREECRILVQCLRVGGKTQIAISDNGRGMSARTGAGVCEPFFQGKRSRGLDFL